MRDISNTAKGAGSSRGASRKTGSRLAIAGMCLGAALILLGALCLILKIASGEHIDTDGFLKESFFLVPLAFTFFACGFIAFAIIGIKNSVQLLSSGASKYRRSRIAAVCISGAVMLIGAAVLIMLISANA